MTASQSVPLALLLQQAADHLSQTQPSEAQSLRTLAAMRAALGSAPAKPITCRWLRWRPVLALSSGVSAAVALLAFALILTLPPPDASGPGLRQETAAAAASDFVPVVSRARWASYLTDESHDDTHTSTAWVVPTEIPADRLALLGLPYDPALAGRLVRAELLMHDSGDVLAVRVVH